MSDYLLEMQGISKSFPGVQALQDVTLQILPGEIHALLGENGAGKSTLMKILSGAYQRDAGNILLNGAAIEINNPHHALQQGIVTIYQESNLATDLNVAENIFMGRLPKRWGFWFSERLLYDNTKKLLQQLNTTFDAKTQVRQLSPAQRQMTEIAKALSMDAKLIVMDEPTASLTGGEVDILLNVVRQLRDDGVSIIFITHRLEEVYELADRATVLRDGHWIATDAVKNIPLERLISQMVGREVKNLFPKQAVEIGVPVLSVKNLSNDVVKDISFELRKSEIVGMFGLVGSGRTDVARCIFGADSFHTGSIEVDGKRVTLHSPADAIGAGIALAPEDRKGQGLVLGMSVRENISLPTLQSVAQIGFLQPHKERQLAQEYRKTMDIKTPSVNTPSRSLSGGNQQKVVISKWLTTQPKVLILDEPTRGIDVAGKAEVHKLITQLVTQGVSILLISSELPEILGMSDRILVMHEGRLVGDLLRSEATEDEIMRYASGQAR